MNVYHPTHPKATRAAHYAINVLTQDGPYTQATLAQKLGVSQTTVNFWKHGKRPIGLQYLKKLHELAGLDTNDLWNLYEPKIIVNGCTYELKPGAAA